MKLRLEPIHMTGYGRWYKNPRGYVIRDERGRDRGSVIKRGHRRWHLRGRGLKALFPLYLFDSKTPYPSPEKTFQRVSDVRKFLADHPERYWHE